MKKQIIRSAQYREDLLGAWSYHAQWSEESADRIVRAIQSKVDLLDNFPGLGERCPQFGDRYRRTLAGRYVIYYEVFDEHIEVLRVLHSAQNTERL